MQRFAQPVWQAQAHFSINACVCRCFRRNHAHQLADLGLLYFLTNPERFCILSPCARMLSLIRDLGTGKIKGYGIFECLGHWGGSGSVMTIPYNSDISLVPVSGLISMMMMMMMMMMNDHSLSFPVMAICKLTSPRKEAMALSLLVTRRWLQLTISNSSSITQHCDRRQRLRTQIPFVTDMVFVFSIHFRMNRNFFGMLCSLFKKNTPNEFVNQPTSLKKDKKA